MTPDTIDRILRRAQAVASAPTPATPTAGQVALVALGVAGIGAAGGMRSTLPLSLVAWGARLAGGAIPGRLGDAPLPLRLLGGERAAPLLAVASAGEVVVDKLPQVPSRFIPPELLARLGTGALAGATLAGLWRGFGWRATLPGALLGAGGAALGAVGGYTARSSLTHATGLPDLVWGLAEDAVALSLGAASAWAALAPQRR